MLIDSMLNKDRTRAKMEGTSKKRVLQCLAAIFANSIAELDETEIFQIFG